MIFISKASSFTWDLVRKMTYVGCVLFDLFLHCYYGTKVKAQVNFCFAGKELRKKKAF